MTKKIMSSLFLLVAFLFTGTAFAQDQKSVDDKLLQDYFKANNIKATKTQSGLYYVITAPGEGPNAKAGQQATMKYRGTLLDGKQFDANMDKNFNMVKDREPFTFALGAGQVIRGWDEGVQLFNKGSRGTLYLPSGLAYGANGAGGVIPPNAVLIFDIEVVALN